MIRLDDDWSKYAKECLVFFSLLKVVGTTYGIKEEENTGVKGARLKIVLLIV